MKQLLKGFLFSLGLVPVFVFSIWLFHNWPLWNTGLEAAEEFSFDRSQIQLGEMKLTRSGDGIRGLGEVTNRSDKPCSFLQLECDLLLDGKIIAHELAVVSSLSEHSTRGYTVYFSGIQDGMDASKLKVQVALAQAFNLDIKDGTANGNQPIRSETNQMSSGVGSRR